MFLKLSKIFNLSEDLTKLLAVTLFFSIGAIQFLGFSTAFVYDKYQAIGTMLYLAFAFFLSFVGYWIGVYTLNKKTYSNGLIIKLSLVLIFLFSSIAAFTNNDYIAVVALSFGSFASGFGWSERHFLEKVHAGDDHRDIYLSILQSLIILLRIGLPVIIAALSFLKMEKQYLFNVGVINLICGLFLPFMPRHNIQEVITFNLSKLKEMIKTQPKTHNNYYLTEGGTSIVKQSLFVIGAVAVLKSISNYAYTESLASLFSGAMMFWLSKHTVTKGLGNISRLRAATLLFTISWISLILSFQYKIFFYAFVISFSIGLPLITAFKHSMVIGIVNANSQSPFVTSLYREYILLISRVLFCLFCALCLYFIHDKVLATQFLCGILLLFLPIEYVYCKKIYLNLENK